MSITLQGPLLLAGAGKMGGAFLSGLLAHGLDPKSIIVQDPSPPDEEAAFLAEHGIAIHASITELPQAPAVVLLAVKPQVMDGVFGPLAKLCGPDTLVISIAAGRRLASIESHLPDGVAVVRAMPNTPAAIRKGMSVAVCNANTSAAQKALASEVLEAVGEVAWVDDEALLDPATAVSGSGPAYVFLLAECLAEAGVAAGLDAELAERLARATVIGASDLLEQSDRDAATLRKHVTSPGGTTEAALSVLMGGDGLKKLMSKAVRAATQRGRELANK